MSSSFARSFLAVCALSVMSAAASTADAAGPNDKVFDAVNAFESKVFRNVDNQAFAVTGILHGQATEQTIPFVYGDVDTAARYAPSCERFALIAMKDAGHYAFVVVTNGFTNPSDGSMPVLGCRLERR